MLHVGNICCGGSFPLSGRLTGVLARRSFDGAVLTFDYLSHQTQSRVVAMVDCERAADALASAETLCVSSGVGQSEIILLVLPFIPSGIDLKSGVSFGNKVHLTWSAVPDAVSYCVYGNGSVIATVTDPSYRSASLVAGEWEFRVTAIDAVGNESEQSAAYRCVLYDVPAIVDVRAMVDDGSIKVTVSFDRDMSGGTCLLFCNWSKVFGTLNAHVIDDYPFAQCSVSGNKAEFVLSGAIPGNYVFKASVTDSAGRRFDSLLCGECQVSDGSLVGPIEQAEVRQVHLTTYRVSGWCDPDKYPDIAHVRYVVVGGGSGNIPVDSTGQFQGDIVADPVEGDELTVELTARSLSGTSGPAMTVSCAVDRVPPAVPVLTGGHVD